MAVLTPTKTKQQNGSEPKQLQIRFQSNSFPITNHFLKVLGSHHMGVLYVHEPKSMLLLIAPHTSGLSWFQPYGTWLFEVIGCVVSFLFFAAPLGSLSLVLLPL